MLYVLEYINEQRETKYVLSSRFTVYCPEFAAAFNDRKTALTVAEKLVKQKSYDVLRVVELSYDIIDYAHAKYGGKKADKLLYPKNYNPDKKFPHL